MNRRTCLKALVCSLVLTAGLNSALGVAQPTIQPQIPSSLFQVFGTWPEPIEIKRVLAANEAAAVMLNSVAPAQLVGWPTALNQTSLSWLSASSTKLPVIGGLEGTELPLSLDQLRDLSPDVIVAVGDGTPQQQAQAERVSTASGIPYVLIKGQLQDAPEQLLWLGSLLGQQRHGQQLASTAQQVLDLAQPVTVSAPTVYWAEGETGLKTTTASSDLSQVFQVAGLKNVVPEEGAPEITLEQIKTWKPDFILTADPAFYQHVFEELDWQEVSAVQNQRVFFVPQVPFGWLDKPASINRLLGIQWLAAVVQQKPEHELINELRHLFIMLYQTDPGVEQLQQLLATPMQFAD